MGLSYTHIDAFADGPYRGNQAAVFLLPEARGAGYATEASRVVIDWAYRVLSWPHVETHMRDENAPARAIAERLGGTIDRRETFPDGVTRDVYVLPRQEVSA